MMPDNDGLTDADRAALAALDARADALTHRPAAAHDPESLDAALSRLRYAVETCTPASLTVRQCRRLLGRLEALAGPVPLASVATTGDGRVLGFRDDAAARAWLLAEPDACESIWTGGYHLWHARESLAGRGEAKP